MQIKNNKIELSKDDFSFVCPLKTADMERIDGGYFCGKCEKKVYDVSNYSPKSFNDLKKKSDNLCISFKKVVVVSFALSLSACATTGKVASTEPCETKNSHTQEDKKNRLAPFKIPDRNQTINIGHVEEVNIAGGMPPPPLELEEKK